MAQLKEGSVIKKPTGDEVIATISDIPEIPTSLPADGGDADTVGGFTVGANVPANAKFTDTVTTINNKTGVISKADIVALGIPAQDTVYTHPTSHPASIITESATKRFVSDAEKAAWNAKAEDAHNHTKADITDMPTKLSEFQNDIGAGGGIQIAVGTSEPSGLQVGDWWYKEV